MHRIFWLIGVTENGEVLGAGNVEPSAWWKQVKAHFDGLAPDIQDAIVGTTPATVILAFETEQPPYVVNIPHEGGIKDWGVHREVPWRVTAGVDSATRQQLIRLFSPLLALPKVDVTFAQVDLTPPDRGGAIDATVSGGIELYLASPNFADLILPTHRCSVSLIVQAIPQKVRSRVYASRASAGISKPQVDGQVRLQGAGTIYFDFNSKVFSSDIWSTQEVEAEISLQAVGMDTAKVVRIPLRKKQGGGSTTNFCMEVDTRKWDL